MELIILILALLLVSCLLKLTFKYPDKISHLCKNFLSHYSLTYNLTKAINPTRQTNSPVASKSINEQSKRKKPKNPEVAPKPVNLKPQGTQNKR